MNNTIVPSLASKSSKKAKILAHLQAGHSITEIEAVQKWNMTCLTQRIFDLKRRGYPIVSVFETNNGKRYKRHFLGEPK